ncbi:MAG: hypothetical protein E7446_05550 [Ruminococcaceae bacterium]|nr:hypothetical protein [Oscillospiraceae bacterium]
MKKAPLRWIMGLLSAAFIVYLWSTKDIAAQYADLPREELIPLVTVNVAVTLVKVVVIAGGIWLLRALAAKANKKK